jgi:glycosyltransferase involved in cell wall biosynthesis
MKASLSVSMIVRNESAHICTALENLREFADEVVVLDTASTDDTKRLAAECGAVVRDFVWCDDFAKARNVSLAYCNEQFVMWLDADDRIPREDALRLRGLLQVQPDWACGACPDPAEGNCPIRAVEATASSAAGGGPLVWSSGHLAAQISPQATIRGFQFPHKGLHVADLAAQKLLPQPPA